MKDINDVFKVLKKVPIKMKVNKKGEIRKGPHCPLTALATELCLGDSIKNAGDFAEAGEALGLQHTNEDVDIFVKAADCKLADLEAATAKAYRRRMFQVFKLPKSAL